MDARDARTADERSPARSSRPVHEPAVPERPGIDQRVVPSRLSVRRKPPLDPGNELWLVDDVPSDRRDRSAVGESRVQQRESREADLHEEFVPWVIAEHDRLFARAHECTQPAGEFMIRHCTAALGPRSSRGIT